MTPFPAQADNDIDRTELDAYEQALSHFASSLPPPRYEHSQAAMYGAQFGDKSAVRMAIHLLIAAHPNKAGLKAELDTQIADAKMLVHTIFAKDARKEFTDAAISNYDAGMANMAEVIDTLIAAQASILQAANQDGADAA